ncbi:hypothetical protein [Kistimonas asteriae]|uniref:hypothetical protein n=1 Tax=Kistimonas asteriae TaxID=517724 RepID=UPI001BA8DD01|nr:hypothetical protein [Kistimonas asteriae]
MAIDPKQLEAEANADYERLMKPAPAEHKATQDTPPSQPTEPVMPTVTDDQPPAPPAPNADTGEGNLDERYKNLRADHTRKAQENADLRRQLENMQQQLNQLSQQSPASALKPDEPDELENAAKDFEELSPLVKKLKAQDEVIREMKASRQQQTQQDYYGRIAAKHADHAQVYQSPEFQGWMSRLSGLDKRAAEMAFNTGTADDVIEVFDRYKQSIGMGNKHEQAAQLAEPTLRSRSQPQTQSSRAKFTWKQIESMSTADYAKNEVEIDRAIQNGEVI